ncbi:MAG: DUF433 domain-containing protein [Methanosarcinales archaeon]
MPIQHNTTGDQVPNKKYISFYIYRISKGGEKIRYQDYIVIDPKIMHGKPVIKGTRIPVYVILNLLAGGMSTKDILKEYPDLTIEDIYACLEYASKLAEAEVGILELEEVL